VLEIGHSSDTAEDASDASSRRIPGLRAVDDQMRTRPVGAEHRTAAETQAEVLDDAVPAYGIDVDVDVDGGKVTLCGAVDIASQRAAAERIALRVLGVSEVRNSAEGVVTVYANPAGSELWGSAWPSWWREVMSSLVKTLRRW
jgi:osmotically-inducible protein OsmY